MTFALRTKLVGRAAGDFLLDNPARRLELPEYLSRVACALPPFEQTRNLANAVFVPKLGFTNRVVRLGDDNETWTQWYFTTAHEADAITVEGDETIAGIHVADCLPICLMQGNRLALLHGGYRCLMRETPDEPNIIEAAFATRAFEPLVVQAWIGPGIGACCWAAEHYPEVLNPSLHRQGAILSSVLQTTAARAPTPGKRSVHLTMLIYRLLEAAGVPAPHIRFEPACTCCETDTSGKPVYWSHARSKANAEPDGRNLFLAWLEEGAA